MARPAPHALSRLQQRQEKADVLAKARVSIRACRPEAIKEALAEGLSPSAWADPATRSSLLHAAVEAAGPEVWEALGKGRPPQAGIDPFVPGFPLPPPVHRHERPRTCPLQLVRDLLDARADARACTLEGWSVLHLAAAHRWWGTPLDLLLKAGANIRRSTRHGETVLHVLLNPKHRARFNLGRSGLNPQASAEVSPTLVHHWIERGAPLDVCDKAGRSVLEAAISGDEPNAQAAMALLDHGVPWTRGAQRVVVQRRHEKPFRGLLARIQEKQLRVLLAEIEVAPSRSRARM